MSGVELAHGQVWHRRTRPAEHAFQYPFWMVWVDLDDLANFGAGSAFWGSRWRLVTLRDSDYTPDQENTGADLRSRVLARVRGLGEDWSQGRIFLLAQPRMLGWLFNPLILYWHFAPGSDQPDAVLAEVQNTPWHERHWYLLSLSGPGPWEVVQPKQFHVSPFLEMAMDYHWQIHFDNNEIRVAIRNHDAEGAIFQAGLRLTREPASAKRMRWFSWRRSWQAMQVSAAIHVHALRLWLKGVPFHAHPRKRKNMSKEN